MSLLDYIPAPDDPRSNRAREILDKNTGGLLHKTTRAGATTSMCAEIMRRRERFTIIEPTNRISLKTLEKAIEISNAGKTIIPILANDNCLKNKALLLKYPEVRQLGILPIQRCETNDGDRCNFYDVCPITRPLRHVIGVGGYGITYHKLIALHLSEGEIAKKILYTILSTNHIIFDECHELGYPSTVSVQIHPENDITKFSGINYPVLPDVVLCFSEILEAAEDAVAQIKAVAADYHRQHLAIKITSPGAITEPHDIGAGIQSLVRLMITRADHNLTNDDVVLLKDMLLLCTERQHVVHGIIDTKADGSKRLRIYTECTDFTYRSIVRRTVTRASDQRRIDGEQMSRLWHTSGTIVDMTGVIPHNTPPILFGDPMDTNSQFVAIADTYRISDRGMRSRKMFERISTDIKRIVSHFGADKCALLVMNKRWYDKIEPELDAYPKLEITWYNSDSTVGVESDRRIWIAVGMAEKPKNAMDAVALSRADGDFVAVSDRLRVERVHIDTFQAWSRAKDPDAQVRSVIVALGCNVEDVRNVVSWHINRKLEISRVHKQHGGSRIHYDVCGDEMIGSSIQIIERGKTNDINELIEKWLDKGDTTPLTRKMFEDFFKRHKDKKMTIRDVHQKMALSRKGLSEKDVEQFLFENGDPVSKSSYIYYLGRNANTLAKVPTENPVSKSSHDTSPLTPQDISTHYRQPLVIAAILQHSAIGSSWRCGNIDFYGWWKRVDDGVDRLQKLYVLPDHSDYSLLVGKGRTLYWSLNFFEGSIRTQHRHKPPDGVEGAVIGEYATTIAYSLGVDIDHADGTNVFDAKDALEAAGSFFYREIA